MPARVFAIVNRKGGVGKTTTAVNLAHGLARLIEGKGHVLLIDLDPQGNCAPSLGIRPNGADIARLLTGELPLERVIVSADRSKSGGPARPNLFLIPATDALAAARANLVAAEAVQMVAARFGGDGKAVAVDTILDAKLGIARQAFSYIILDCPPSLDVLNNAVYHFADEAIVPVKVDYLGLTGAAMHMHAQAGGIDIGLVIPTFVRAREKLAREMMSALIKAYGRSRVAPPIPQAVVVEQAPAVGGGLTLLEYAPESPPALAYQKIAEKIHHG